MRTFLKTRPLRKIFLQKYREKDLLLPRRILSAIHFFYSTRKKTIKEFFPILPTASPPPSFRGRQSNSVVSSRVANRKRHAQSGQMPRVSVLCKLKAARSMACQFFQPVPRHGRWHNALGGRFLCARDPD